MAQFQMGQFQMGQFQMAQFQMGQFEYQSLRKLFTLYKEASYIL